MRALISHWLHEEPEDEIERMADQSAAALWLEERYFKNMAKIFGKK
jgi:hypothetical protein